MVMRYAILEGNRVANVAVATPEYAAEQGWVACPNAGPGWSFDGATFSPPPRDIAAEWAQVRAQRNALLAESDAHVLPDRWAVMSEEQREAWSAYRQALRDIPQTFADPQDVVWPVPPT